MMGLSLGFALVTLDPSVCAYLSASQKLLPGTVIVVTPTPGDGVRVRTPAVAILPRITPYRKGSFDEQLYLRGFSLGFLDSMNGRFH